MMQKKETMIGIGAIIVVALAVFLFGSRNTTAPQEIPEEIERAIEGRMSSDYAATDIDLGNTVYTIDDRRIPLVDGSFESAVNGSSAVYKTKLLEGPAFADVDGDGVKDAVVLLRDETGGTGIFYYTAAVLSKAGSWLATDTVFIGDRIRIKEISIDNGVISISVLERGDGEAMTAEPTLPMVYQFKIEGDDLVVIE